MDDAARRYSEFLDQAQADPNVLGVIRSGSRVNDAFVTPRSDFDCYVVTNAPDEERWPHVRGSAVETVAVTVEQFQRHATAGSATYWNRPSFIYARVDFERRPGQIATLLEAKRRLTPDEADLLVRQEIGGYVNSLYRSLKNLRDGRDLAGRLDARESISPLLTTVFALEGRVRPFNKWLAFELQREPLPIERFLAAVTDVGDAPYMAGQQALFRQVETLVRMRGYGDLIDEWHPDVPLFRGEPSH